MSAPTPVPYANPSGPAGEVEWAEDLLYMIGSPAKSFSDPRVVWLASQEQEEGNPPGSATYAAEHNPLDTTLQGPQFGSSVVTWKDPTTGQTVQGAAYDSVEHGLEATAATIEEPGFAPYLAALKDPSTSLEGMQQATAEVPWLSTNSTAEQGYASTVAGIARGYTAPSGCGNDWLDPIKRALGIITPCSSPFPGPAKGLWDVVTAPGATAVGGVKTAASHVGSSVVKDALYVVAAVAVVALVGGGIAMTAKSSPKQRFALSGEGPPELADAA